MTTLITDLTTNPKTKSRTNLSFTSDLQIEATNLNLLYQLTKRVQHANSTRQFDSTTRKQYLVIRSFAGDVNQSIEDFILISNDYGLIRKLDKSITSTYNKS